jgi:hypothetical protein
LPNDPANPLSGNRFYLRGNPKLLDAPGEWIWRKTGTGTPYFTNNVSFRQKNYIRNPDIKYYNMASMISGELLMMFPL